MNHMFNLHTWYTSLHLSTITINRRVRPHITDGHTITIHTNLFKPNETGHLRDVPHGLRIAIVLRHV